MDPNGWFQKGISPNATDIPLYIYVYISYIYISPIYIYVYTRIYPHESYLYKVLGFIAHGT